MTKITQKQLIESLSQLKEIKPNKEWASLLKSTLLENKVPGRMTGAVPTQRASFMSAISNSFGRRLAYSFAAILILAVGAVGLSRYTVPGDLLFPVKKIAEQSQATLGGQTVLNQDVAVLNNRISDLAQVAKDGRTGNIPSAISEVNANAKYLAKNLKKNPATDSKTIKAIANSLKTLADVPGTDLTASSDVKDLYQAVVASQIADLKKMTLTDDQKETLAQAEDLYSQAKYTDALEKLLLVSK